MKEVLDGLNVFCVLHMAHSDASFRWLIGQEVGIKLLVSGHALDWGLSGGVRERRVAIFTI